jgi:hypothetical protein
MRSDVINDDDSTSSEQDEGNSEKLKYINNDLQALQAELEEITNRLKQNKREMLYG